MACYRPLKAYKAPDGGIQFTSSGAYTHRLLEIPCGQCIGCRREHSRQWAIRMLHEAQMHEQNSFITLTYSPEHYPENNSLDVKHWQTFAKRLRHQYGRFRFYHCGEYGEQTQRAHYHAAIFGLDFSDDRKPFKKSGEHQLYKSERLDNIWAKGNCLIGNMTFESAAYIAQYVIKKITGEKAEAHYQGRKPEYSTMSRSPGIGTSWYQKFKSDVYPRDEVIMRGMRMQPPKFYDDLYTLEEPEKMAFIKKRRKGSAYNNPNNTQDRRDTINEVKTRNARQNARELFL